MTQKSLLVILLTSLVFATEPASGTTTYEIDKDHSSVLFSVMHNDLNPAFGRFTEFSGKVSFNPAAPDQASCDITINPASIYTANQKRDDHLRGVDFFNVKRFDAIRFVSKSAKVENGKLVLSGDLTLLDKTLAVSFKLDMPITKTNQKGTPMLGLSGKGSFKRSDFGMTKYLGGIGDEVTVILSAHAE